MGPQNDCFAFQTKGIQIFANEEAKNEQRNVRNDSAYWNWGIWESNIGSEMGYGPSLCDENIGQSRCDSGGQKCFGHSKLIA